MEMYGVIQSSPLFYQDIGFNDCVTGSSIGQLITHSSVERINKSVSPRNVRLDELRMDAEPVQSLYQVLGNILTAVIAANLL